jgi:hypothetical protein
MPAISLAADTARRATLRAELLTTVDLLKRRRASEIAETAIQDYVDLHWLEWHGGSLRLTTTGENMCKHLTSVLDHSGAQAAREPRRASTP